MHAMIMPHKCVIVCVCVHVCVCVSQIDAEKLILAANGQGGLKTVALRPSAIFGEHDPILVPTTIKQVSVCEQYM